MLDPLGAEVHTGFAEQHVREQAAAHANLAMNPPDCQLDALDLERLAPRHHMLIDAIDQRTVEVEDKGHLVARCGCSQRGLFMQPACCLSWRCVTLSGKPDSKTSNGQLV